jgi:hypothetical protein
VQYLTYEQYKSMGGTLDSTAFNRNIDRACAIVDNHTKGRFREMRDLPQEAKLCLRDLVEYVAENVSRGKIVLSKSQSAGGVSESESYVAKTTDDMGTEMENIIFDYLATVTDDYFVPVLYRGVAR